MAPPTAKRYRAFVTTLGRRLAKEPKLRQDITEDVAAASDEN